MTIQRTHKNIRGIVLTTIALAGIFTLASCSAPPAETPAPEDTAITQPVETTEPVETDTPDEPVEAPTTDLAAGDTVDAATAEAINAAGGIGDDKAYPMPDGTYVFVAGDEPAPQAVVDAVTGVVRDNAGATATISDSTEFSDAMNEMLKAANGERSKTGKLAAVVHHGMAGQMGQWVPMWSIESAGPVGAYGSKDEAVAAAQAWVAADPGARMMLIVDAING